jgi:hypothetical protein
VESADDPDMVSPPTGVGAVEGAEVVEAPYPPETEPDGSTAHAPHPRRSIGIVVGAVVVVAVIVLVALLWSGILSSSIHPNGATTVGGSGETSATAYALANSTARQQADGPWSLVSEIGFATLGTLSIPPPTGGSACAGSGGASNVPPVSLSSLRAGQASLWAFSFRNPSASTLSVEVEGTTSTVLGIAPASAHCLGSPRGGVGTLPTPDRLSDSARAVSLLGSAYSGFLSNFSTMSVAFSLTDAGGEIGSSNTTAYWTVFATPCINWTSGFGGRAGDPALTAGLNAINGAVVFTHSTNGLGSCLSPGTLNGALWLGPPDALYGIGGPYAYNITIAVLAVNGSVTPASFTPVLVNEFNSSPLATSPLFISAADGAVLAEYSFTAKSWVSGGSMKVQVGDRFAVGLDGTTGFAATLVLEGNPPLTGAISCYLD